MLKRIKKAIKTEKAREKLDDIGLYSIVVATLDAILILPAMKIFHSKFLFWLMIAIAAVGFSITVGIRIWYFKDEIIEFKNDYYAKNFEEMEELRRQKRHEKIKKH